MRLVSEASRWGASSCAPLVSIYLLTHNHEKYIEQSLQSIFSQKVDFPYEVLIYDDCSTDKTVEIIKKLTPPSNVLVRFFSASENLYSQNLLNYATYQIIVSASQADFIAYLEGDDFYTDERKIQKQFDYLTSNNEVGFCFHDVVKVDESGQFIGHLIPNEFRRDYTVSELQSFQFAYIHASSVMWRKGFAPWPPEYFCCTNNADMFCPFIWSGTGPAKYMTGVLPNGYRQTANGIWVGATDEIRKNLKLQTALLMMSSYLRKNDKNSAKILFLNRVGPQLQRFLRD